MSLFLFLFFRFPFLFAWFNMIPFLAFRFFKERNRILFFSYWWIFMSRTALLLLIVCCVALLCIHIAYHRFRHSITIINYSCIRPTHPQLTQLNHFSTSLLQGGIVCNCNSLLFSYIKHSSFSTAPSKSEVLCERIPSLEGSSTQ